MWYVIIVIGVYLACVILAVIVLAVYAYFFLPNRGRMAQDALKATGWAKGAGRTDKRNTGQMGG